MCSTPKMPNTNTDVPEQIATPTMADASVRKAGLNTRNQNSALANRNIRTSSLGVTDDAQTNKKTLLGE